MRVLLVLALLVVAAQADMYLHNPPGSNDRNRERSDNRNNANLLFDSQNNAQGGYPWRGNAMAMAPDPITYYAGSKLKLEWTNQHACGPNPNTHCQLVIQMTCNSISPGLRDGTPQGDETQSDNDNQGYLRRQFSGTGGQNADGTRTIPEDKFADDPVAKKAFYVGGLNGGAEYHYHEGIEFYERCKGTKRNTGLYQSDQNVNRNDQTGTRQNTNGERHGLECPEERDYYPWWQPTRWVDLAVLVSNEAMCGYLQANSENVAPRGYCACNDACRSRNNGLCPWEANECVNATCQGQWIVDPTVASFGLGAPDCRLHDFGRDNHLGSTAATDGGKPQAPQFQPEAQSYWLDIPGAAAGSDCVIRMRYNISQEDYPNQCYNGAGFKGGACTEFNSAMNCRGANAPGDAERAGNFENSTKPLPHCRGLLDDNTNPLFNRPYVRVFDSTYPTLSIALNTDQNARTFQDRSYVFRVAKAPNSGKIWNLNVRGRRGNIVQAYPAVEYDFVPNTLVMNEGDWIHFQMHGSDFNAAKNANNGEGWQYSDRSNLVELKHQGGTFPKPNGGGLFDNVAIARRFALLDQDPLLCARNLRNGSPNEQNRVDNCGKLNRAPARWPQNPADGLFSPSKGTYHYVSTRNNNFTNRSQKASIIVKTKGLTAGQIAGIVVGSVAGVAAIAGGVLFYGKKHPNSKAGAAYSKVSGCFNRGGKSLGTTSAPVAATTATPMGADREYRRY